MDEKGTDYTDKKAMGELKNRQTKRDRHTDGYGTGWTGWLAGGVRVQEHQGRQREAVSLALGKRQRRRELLP